MRRLIIKLIDRNSTLSSTWIISYRQTQRFEKAVFYKKNGGKGRVLKGTVKSIRCIIEKSWVKNWQATHNTDKACN